MEEAFDVVVIGAGVVGSAIARWLSRFDGSFAVLEKKHDVGMAASVRNSGVIHAGINCLPGTLRARFCMEGRELLQDWSRQLNVPFIICGKLVVARSEDELPGLMQLMKHGEANGVVDLRMVSGTDAAELQPGIECIAALHVPTSGIVSPYALTIAMAEDAATHGVRFFLGTEVIGIEPESDAFAVTTTAGTVRGRVVVNSAGIHAGRVAQLLDPDAPNVYPCVGEYLILDKQVGEQLTMSIYPAPRTDNAGLGVHITPTMEGNVLLGPSSEYVLDPETTCCTRATTSRLLDETRIMWPGIPAHLVIGAYAGVRSKLTPAEVSGFSDYRFRRTPDHPKAIHLLGIESPGLTAAPAIAQYVVEELVRSEVAIEPKPREEIPVRRWPDRFEGLPETEKRRLVHENPDHGEIVCRCEGVTKRELLHALDNPLGVRTLSGIKFRSRASMGRCGGGYCLPRIVEILQEERGWTPDDFLLRGPESPAFAGRLLEDDHVPTSP
jgi:glycerol-3-phosphate dehydrogenase